MPNDLTDLSINMVSSLGSLGNNMSSPIMNLSGLEVTTLSNLSLAQDEPVWSLLQKMIFGTWLSLSMLCAIFGNLMVIVVVVRHKGMQTRTNMFLVNLAVADFMVGIILAPFSLTTLIKEEWIFGDAMCNVNGFFNNICFITSIHTLMYISIHKYVSITRPFSRILNHVKILVMIACAWIWSIICAILTMFVLSKVVYKTRTTQCGPEYPKNNLEYLHHVIIQVTNIIIPLAIMTFAYLRMFCEFRQHAIRLRKNTTLQSDQILGQQIQVTKTLFIVLACYILCWFPYATYTTYVSMVEDKTTIPGWMNPLAYCFMYMNSGCNPIIYAWRSPSFREGYKQILCQKSAYIVSDDTIRDTDSPSIIRRLSTLLHSSFRSTRLNSRRNSEDGSSLNSVHISRTASVSSPSHTLLKRATSKTAKGSSIIRKDGSLIITKNGKIISVRRDIDSLKRDRSFSGFEDLSTTQSNGISSKSLTDIHIINRDRLELTPLLRRERRINGSSQLVHSSNENCAGAGHKTFHASLSKIDSVDETETAVPKYTNKLRPPSQASQRSQRDDDKHSTSTIDKDQGEVTSQPPIIQLGRGQSPCSSMKSELDEVFMQSPVIITFNSQESVLNAMSLEPSLKDRKQLAKSDMQLDTDDKNGDQAKTLIANKSASKSANVIFKVPLLRCPSIETLDVQPPIPRCSSDASTIRKLIPKSPLYKRRWLEKKAESKTKVDTPPE